MRRLWLLIGGAIALLAALVWTPYILVDRAYERLLAVRPVDRRALEAELAGFSGQRLLDSGKMQHRLAASVAGEREYWRYKRFGLSIDVVYDRNGAVYAI